jgi:hypothetical protein
MTPDQILDLYIMKHPDFWDFENEINEVARLTELCNYNQTSTTFSKPKE